MLDEGTINTCRLMGNPSTSWWMQQAEWRDNEENNG